MVIELLRRICNGFLLRFRTLFRYVFGLAKGNGSEQNQLTTFTKSLQSPLSALIIGIDKYTSDTIPNAKGAVPSANAFYTYIKNTLGVPDAQIQILLDQDATRENIMNELLSFKDKRGGSGSEDPIVIYFAGHGNMGTVRDASGDRKVEMILPCDSGVKGKKTVHGISAGTISMILEDISKVKGDNIILILDCDFPNQTRVLPSTLDSEITKNHLTCGVNHTSHSFIADHFSKFIVITAGDEVVTTQPQWKCGYLTNALLEHLTDLKTLNMSYNDFYKLLPEALILHVAGDISSRQLFDGKVTSSKYMPVFFKRVGGQSVYKLSSGLDEGVRMGSVYSAYSSLLQALDGSKACGTLSVTGVTREESTLTALDMTEELEAGYAVLKTVSNALHVHLSDNLLPTVTSVVTPEQLIQVSEENAVLSLSLQQNVLRVVIKDNRVIGAGLSFVEVECDLKRESIQYMIKGLSHYHYILNRASDITVNQIVSVDLFRLSAVPGEYTKDLRPYRVENGESLVVDGEAQVPASRSVPYGIKISNHTSLDFYAYLFFMDNYDFSIMSYYISHANSLESRLAANSSIKIGYEDSDHPPVIYYLRPGVNVEVGFIKLFVSTEPLDMSRVAQDSPFDFAKVGHEGKFVDKKPVWGAASAKIVQVPPDSEEEEYDD